MKKREMSREGRTIKMMIAFAGMTQKEFCEKFDVPQNRLSDIIHSPDGSRVQIPLRMKIYKILMEVFNEKKESV